MLQACTALKQTVGKDDIRDSYKAYDAHLAGCTTTYGFDPRRAQGLGDYQLAPNERGWRNCAYEGIRTILIPAAHSPEMYWRWIAEDQLMTDLIEKRQMTRAQRDQRLRQLQEQIAASEKADEGTRSDQNLNLTRGTYGILQGLP